MSGSAGCAYVPAKPFRCCRRTSVPKPRSVDMSLLDHLSALWAPKANRLPTLSGPAFVLGSAPGAQPPPDGLDWTFATVNGSQAILQGWGHSPDLTLFGRTFI